MQDSATAPAPQAQSSALYLAVVVFGEMRVVAGAGARDAAHASHVIATRAAAHAPEALLEMVLSQADWIARGGDIHWTASFARLGLREGEVSFLDQVLTLPPRSRERADLPDAQGLHTALLGAPAPRGEDGLPAALGHIFAPDKPVLALCDATGIFGLPERLANSGLPHRCLFRGEAERTQADAAPWLVSLPANHALTRALLAADPDEPSFLAYRNFICLLPNAADMDNAEAQFRRLTRIRSEVDGKWLYFRFTDARTLDDLRSVLEPEDVPALIPEGGLIALGEQIRQYDRALEIAPGGNAPRRSFTLRPAYLRAMSHRQLDAFRAEMVAALVATHPLVEAEATALTDMALDFCEGVGLKSRDTVMGYALLTGRFGYDMVRRFAIFAPLADTSQSEAQRKTLIHYELRKLDLA